MIPIGHPMCDQRVSQGKEQKQKERKRNAHDAL